MKKLYILLFAVIIFQVRAQSWCTPGSVWHYALPNPGDGYAKYSYMYDTIVGTKTCNKIKVEAQGHGLGGFVINYSNYIYTYSQNGVVFKNNGTLNLPVYDTLYNFIGAIGTKWRCQLSGIGGGQSCAQSYIEITDAGTLTIQGQTLNWRKIFYKNYYFYGQVQQWIESGTDTIFERIGTRNQMEFISGNYCADATDVTPFSFRCFSDNLISLQSSTVACDYVTGIKKTNTETYIDVNNPVVDFIYVNIKYSTNKDAKHIVLIDQLGNKVYDRFQTENEFGINAQNLSNGIYILQISLGTQDVNRKLVIQK